MAAVDTAERAPEEALAAHFFAHHDLRAASSEPPIIVRTAERTIEPWRRNLQRIGRRHHVLHVENRAQIAADASAILHADALFRRRSGAGPVNSNPQHHPGRLAAELHLEDFQAVPGSHTGRRVPHPTDHVSSCHRSALKQKKWAHAHSVLHLGSELKIIPRAEPADRSRVRPRSLRRRNLPTGSSLGRIRSGTPPRRCRGLARPGGL